MEKTIVLDIETTGLNAWYGDRITCICAKYENSVFRKYNEDEKQLLLDFSNFWIAKMPEKLVTKNGLMFDLPFIFTRSVLNGLPISKNEIYYNVKHIDLHTITNKWVSLNDMCKLFNIPTKIGNGKDAIDWWYNKEYQKLLEYCYNDVLCTEKLYERLLSLGTTIKIK